MPTKRPLEKYFFKIMFHTVKKGGSVPYSEIVSHNKTVSWNETKRGFIEWNNGNIFHRVKQYHTVKQGERKIYLYIDLKTYLW